MILVFYWIDVRRKCLRLGKPYLAKIRIYRLTSMNEVWGRRVYKVSPFLWTVWIPHDWLCFGHIFNVSNSHRNYEILLLVEVCKLLHLSIWLFWTFGSFIVQNLQFVSVIRLATGQLSSFSDELISYSNLDPDESSNTKHSTLLHSVPKVFTCFSLYEVKSVKSILQGQGHCFLILLTLRMTIFNPYC